MPRPKSHYRTGRFAGMIRERFANAPHVTKPDVDNTIKFCFDALSTHFFVDDAQITTVTATKRYTRGQDDPVGTWMTILPARDVTSCAAVADDASGAGASEAAPTEDAPAEDASTKAASTTGGGYDSVVSGDLVVSGGGGD